MIAHTFLAVYCTFLNNSHLGINLKNNNDKTNKKTKQNKTKKKKKKAEGKKKASLRSMAAVVSRANKPMWGQKTKQNA